MVGLIKQKVNMNKVKGNVVSQITLDDDVIVPDRMPDIGNKILEKGNVLVDTVKVLQNKVTITGKLKYNMLYKAQGADIQVQKLDGDIDFDEVINMDGIEEGDTISIDILIDDLTISVINSRKISVKGIITANLSAEEMQNEEMITGLEDDEDIEYITDAIDLTQIAMRKKDILRVREEIDLETGKLNINDVIWNSASLSGVQIKLLEDKVNISGEISMFALYTAEEGPLQWTNAMVPFNGVIEMNGCQEDMIPDIELKLGNTIVDAKPDYDGEQRMLQLDTMLIVDIKLYEENHMDTLKDVYSGKKNLCPTYKEEEYENLLQKNIMKCRVSDKIKAKSSGNDAHIMQICDCTGEIKLDDITIQDGGIVIEGAIDVCILYICSDDTNPLCCIRDSIPFTQKAEVNGIKDNSIYNVRPSLETLQATMSGTDEVEVKAAILFDCMVFDKISKNIMTGIEENEYDIEKIAAIPAMTGYVVKRNDTIWDIAKKYHTTVNSVREINDIKSGEPETGQILLVVKKMMSE